MRLALFLAGWLVLYSGLMWVVALAQQPGPRGEPGVVILDGFRPPPGLCLPCRYRRCRDGDTVEISLPESKRRWAIRLKDCWAPEMNEPGGPAAKRRAEELLEEAEQLHVFIPAPGNWENLLANLTFDRIPGYIWLSDLETLNGRLIREGHATAERVD